MSWKIILHKLVFISDSLCKLTQTSFLHYGSHYGFQSIKQWSSTETVDLDTWSIFKLCLQNHFHMIRSLRWISTRQARRPTSTIPGCNNWWLMRQQQSIILCPPDHHHAIQLPYLGVMSDLRYHRINLKTITGENFSSYELWPKLWKSNFGQL